MDNQINDIEARVLGSLMEKSLATPEYYPLSLNALTNACNQKSSRNPVVSYAESTVHNAVDNLDQLGLVNESHSGRVIKYEEMFSQKHGLLPKETAILCILLLRGPQTIGELRSRSARMYQFESAEELQEALNNLQKLGILQRLERLAGHKEGRYHHLLCKEDIDLQSNNIDSNETNMHQLDLERIENIENNIESLQERVEAIEHKLDDFMAQFK